MHPARFGAAATAVLHVVVFSALLSHEPARSAFIAAAPIMVDWIRAPQPEEARPEPPKPRPKPIRRQPKLVEPPPVITTQPEAPSPVLANTPPTPEPPPAPEPVAVAPAPAPAPVAMETPPVFDAAYLDNPSPAYPSASRKAGEQGRVVLRVLVNPAGRADEVEVRSSSGFRRLDDSARETVLRWKFVPAKRGAQAVKAWVLIPISFRLES